MSRRVEAEAQIPQDGRLPERRQVDAVGAAGARVECVDERRAAVAVVERVRPAAVGARRAGEGAAAHLVASLPRIGHGLGGELAGANVVGAARVARSGRSGRCTGSGRRASRRGETASKLKSPLRVDQPSARRKPGVHDHELVCERGKPAAARSGRAFARPRTGRPPTVVGDGRDREGSGHTVEARMRLRVDRPSRRPFPGRPAWSRSGRRPSARRRRSSRRRPRARAGRRRVLRPHRMRPAGDCKQDCDPASHLGPPRVGSRPSTRRDTAEVPDAPVC